MSMEHIPKSLKRFLKYVFLVYATFTIIYASIHFYKVANTPHTRARRGLHEARPMNANQSIIKQEIIYHSYLQEVMSNSVLQSKLSSTSMGSSNITPYYSKATSHFHNEDISISTIVTSDRFPIISRLASRYKGPISAVVHINDDETKHIILSQLDETINSNPDMRKYVDIHLIIDKFDRQFNMWRNAAKLYARTDYIMMLDIDFYPCTDFRNHILQNPQLMQMLREGHTALVVPAFEYLDHLDGADYTHFPKTKDELLELVYDQEKVDMFHRTWVNGHASTNYAKWYTANDIYKVTDYNFSYEPYVVFKRESSPWCDERFIGYGANKAACLYEMYISGIDYYVLPEDFIIHQSHAYPEATRRKEVL